MLWERGKWKRDKMKCSVNNFYYFLNTVTSNLYGTVSLLREKGTKNKTGRYKRGSSMSNAHIDWHENYMEIPLK